MTLRVVDGGTVGALRSQAQWHGLSSAMTADAAPVLSFCSPAEPYVGIGYHRRLDEIDLGACSALGLPVLRRQVGGGPVYLDSDQLFFQLILPFGQAPRRVDLLYRRLLEPAVEAFRRLGVDATLRGMNEIAAGRRKLSGTAAGRIGDGVVVVGNVLFRFPHERMVQVLALPHGSIRCHCLRLMRRHVSSLEMEGVGPVSRDRAKEVLVESYAAALGERPLRDHLTKAELEAIHRWESRLTDPDWLAGPASQAQRSPTTRQIKICDGVWLILARDTRLRIEAAIVDGVLEGLWLAAAAPDTMLNGTAEALRRRLLRTTATPSALCEAVTDFAEIGSRVLTLLAPALRAP